MKTPRSFKRLMCSCSNDRVWTDGRCTACGKPTEIRSLTDAQLFGVIRRLERKAEGAVGSCASRAGKGANKQIRD